MGQTANINPLLFTDPVHFTPVYQTADGNGALGAGNADGVWWIERGRLHCNVVLRFGAGLALGTGEVLAPIPNGYQADIASMANSDPGFGLGELAATTQKAAVNAIPAALLLAGGSSVFLAGLATALAGAIAGDLFTANYSFPIKTILPDPETTE